LAEDSVEVKLRAEDESKLIALADIMKKES
jgi:hypothetical protein